MRVRIPTPNRLFSSLVFVIGFVVTGTAETGPRPQRDQTQRLTCTSENFQYETCRVNGRVVDLRLRKKKSSAACTEDETFGYRRDFVWVDQGCSAEFDVTFREGESVREDNRPWWDLSGGESAEDRLSELREIRGVICRSRSGRYTACRMNGEIVRLDLRSRLSSAPCQEGRGYGYRDQLIWVDRGCEGRFDVVVRSELAGSAPSDRPTTTREVTCTSRNSRYETCRLEADIVALRLRESLSNAPCREGKEFGYHDDFVWVDEGCSARFEVDISADASPGDTNLQGVRREVTCRSRNGRYQSCRVDGEIVSVRLRRSLTSALCRENLTFGHERNLIWVDRGCSAIFDVSYRSDTSQVQATGRVQTTEITCTSRNNRYQTCPAGGKVTRLRLRDRLSRSSCRKGTDYGYRRDYVWVARGCSGRFEVTFDSGNAVIGSATDPPAKLQTSRIACKSENFRYRTCTVEGQVVELRLLKTKSRARCTEGESYGYRRDYVWVDKGCSGEFEVRHK